MIRERRKIIKRNYLISASLLEVISGIILFLAIPLLELYDCIMLYRAGYVLSGIGVSQQIKVPVSRTNTANYNLNF